MPTININQFSCIDSATIDVRKMTILIGPQASGKSVISKLVYFFNHCIHQIYRFRESEETFKTYNTNIVELFKLWFPPQTWGKRKFSIQFTAGSFDIRVSRTTGKGPSKNVKITFSEAIINEHDRVNTDLVAALGKLRTKSGSGESPEFRHYDIIWSIQSKARARISKLLRSDFSEYQLFVPAGRSFFTSVGKALVAFEQGGILDPITMRFGKFFASLRERGHIYYGHHKEDKALNARRDAVREELFGGKIKLQRDDAYVETNDGRIIPFPFLSSGQQELLPLWLVLDDFLRADNSGHLIYIEEPEAHLFPSAQETLIEFLSSVVGHKADRKLFLTTHSPYVLSKINNLLKAGALGKRLGKPKEQAIDTVVSKFSWLHSSSTSAYAIIDKTVVDIMDDDGLIDGEYLDGVSQNISDQFLSLLDIETSGQP